MKELDTTMMPGDATIERKKRTSPWEYLLMSVVFGGLAVGLVAWGIVAPDSSVRMPWIAAVLLDLIGPIGMLALLALASIGSFIAAIRAFFSRG